MILLQQHESVDARRDIFVQMVAAADYVTPKTGLSLSVQIVKPGGLAYTSAGATVHEVGAGTYRLRLAGSDLDTLGPAMLRITAGGAADQYVPIQVVRMLDEIHLVKAALANARSHVIGTGVNQIRDDDGTTVLRTLSPSESNGVISVAAS
jgi:hypothetical protein